MELQWNYNDREWHVYIDTIDWKEWMWNENKNKQPKKHETKTNSVMRCNFSVEMCKFLIIYDTNERDCSCVMWQSVTVFS